MRNYTASGDTRMAFRRLLQRRGTNYAGLVAVFVLIALTMSDRTVPPAAAQVTAYGATIAITQPPPNAIILPAPLAAPATVGPPTSAVPPTNAPSNINIAGVQITQTTVDPGIPTSAKLKVLGETVTPAPATPAFTGSNVKAPIRAALALVVLGAAALAIGRRRRPRSRRPDRAT